MNRKLALLIVWVIVVLVGMIPATISLEISVGVKESDWIEYKIAFTGTPPENYQTWIKIEILSVQGTSVTLNATSKYSDETQKTRSMTADLETGGIDLFIIPAGLNTGDTFYDKYVGDVTISGVEERTYTDVRWTVVFATVLQANVTLFWDKTTGVLLEATQSCIYIHDACAHNYTMNVKVDNTNMWQALLLDLTRLFSIF